MGVVWDVYRRGQTIWAWSRCVGVVLDKMYMLMHMWAFAVFAAFIGIESES